MIRDEYIWGKFEALKPEEKIKVLLDMLDNMAETKNRNKADCIATAMGISLFPKVKRIEDIEGYKVTVRFDHNKVRLIDFARIFTRDKPFHNIFLEDYEKFREVEVLEGTLAWPNVGTWSKNVEGNEVFDYYDVDPGFLYELSTSAEYDQAT